MFYRSIKNAAIISIPLLVMAILATSPIASADSISDHNGRGRFDNCRRYMMNRGRYNGDFNHRGYHRGHDHNNR